MSVHHHPPSLSHMHDHSFLSRISPKSPIVPFDEVRCFNESFCHQRRISRPPWDRCALSLLISLFLSLQVNTSSTLHAIVSLYYGDVHHDEVHAID